MNSINKSYLIDYTYFEFDNLNENKLLLITLFTTPLGSFIALSKNKKLDKVYFFMEPYKNGSI